MSTLQPAAQVWTDLTKGQHWTHQGSNLIPESEIKAMKYTKDKLTAQNNTGLHGLHGGQVAGISIGVTLLAAILVSLVFLGLKRRKAFSTSSPIDVTRQSTATLFDHMPPQSEATSVSDQRV
jgi:hypothetical protein